MPHVSRPGITGIPGRKAAFGPSGGWREYANDSCPPPTKKQQSTKGQSSVEGTIRLTKARRYWQATDGDSVSGWFEDPRNALEAVLGRKGSRDEAELAASGLTTSEYLERCYDEDLDGEVPGGVYQ
jgi:hypothetical protein